MLLAPLERVLNRNIAASSTARAACKRLTGRTLAMAFVAAPESRLLTLYFSSDGERVSIGSKADLPIAASLTGTPLGFASMLRPEGDSALRSGAIKIEGDVEVAQSFRELLKASRPDVEEELARLIGDVAAHQLGNFARGVLSAGRRVADTFAQNVAEYLQEETRDVVTRTELGEYVDSVDHLRDGVDRAAATLSLLERRAGSATR